MPIIKAQDVQYCTLQCPDLDIQEQFLIHFGMHTVEKTEDMLLMKGDGNQPFIEKIIKGDKKFIKLALFPIIPSVSWKFKITHLNRKN